MCGTGWQNSPTFYNVPAGQTTLYAQNISLGCRAQETCTSAGNSTPGAPNISKTDPPCGGTQGTISASYSNSLGVTWEFSINNGAWTGNGNWTATPGTYSIRQRVQVGTGTMYSCPSAATTITINNPPTTPTVSINAPTAPCSGGAVTLAATPSISGGSYSWSTGSSAQAITATPSTSGTNYAVTYSLNGCTASASRNIAAKAQPTVSVNIPTAPCAGTAVSLTATPSPGGGSYSWSTGSNLQSISAIPATSGSTYSVTYNLNGCTVSASQSITAKVVPTVSINTPAVPCSGSPVSLTATPSTGGGVYSWSTGATTQTINPTPTTTGSTYNVTYSLNGCTNTAARTVTASPAANAGTDGSTTACASSTASISLATIITGDQSGGTWARTSGTGGTFNASAGTFTPSGTTTGFSTFQYTVLGTSPCPNDISIATVNTSATPYAGADGNTTSCANSTTAISLAGLITGEDAGGTWTRTSGTGGTFNAAAGTFIPNGTATATSTFAYTVSATSPCTGSDASAATVNITPVLNAGTSGSTSICATSTAQIDLFTLITGEMPGGSWTSTSGTGGTFNAAAGTFIPSGNGTTGTRTFTYTVSNSCSSGSAIATVNINSCCSLAVAANATAISCAAGASFSTVNAAVNNGSGNYTYAWMGPNGFTSTAASFTTTTTGSYNVTVTDVNTANCTAQSTATVTSTVNNPVLVLSGSNPVCTNSPVTIAASVQSGTSAGPFTYQFSNNSGTVLQNGSSNTLTIIPAGISSIIVKATGSNGCSSIQSIPVNSPGPTLTLTNIVSICAGQSTTVTADNGGIASYTYFWIDNSTTNPVRTVTPPVTTNYTVVRTTPQGCKDTATATVQVFAKPVIQSVANVQPACSSPNGSIMVTASGNASLLRYRLNNGAWQSSNVFSNLAAGSYIVTVGNSNGVCNDTTTSQQVLAPVSTINSGINGPTARCANEDMQFQAQPPVIGATYAWSATGNPTITNGSTNNNFIVRWDATQSGTQQTVTLTVSSGGCTQTYNQAITITGAIYANAGPDKGMCPASQVTIGTTAAFGAGGTTPFATYSWTPTTYIISGATQDKAVVNPPVTTIYTLTVIDPVNGCTKTDQVTVNVSVAYNPVADAGPDKTLLLTGTPNTTLLGGPNTTLQGAESNANIAYFWTAVGSAPINALTNTNTATPTFTRPAGAAAGASYKYVLNVQKQYVNPSINAGVTCPAVDTVAITIGDQPVCFSIRAYLYGSIVTNALPAGTTRPVMRDNLRRSPFTGKDYLPVSDPYLTAPYNLQFTPVLDGLTPVLQTVTDTTTLFGNHVDTSKNITDWVFVELRSKTDVNTVISTRSVLIQRDGNLIDVNGSGCIRFPQTPADNYYVSIRHRNHLGTMVATPVAKATLTGGGTIDFTTLTAAELWDRTDVPGLNYNGLEQTIVNGYNALWAGNTNSDARVKYTGAANDLDPINEQVVLYPANTAYNTAYDFAFGYYSGDVDMNSKVKYTGANNDVDYINEWVLTFPLNTAYNAAYDFKIEQLPRAY